MRKKNQSAMKSYASEVLEGIRSECKKNQQGQFIHTSYKPLLLQSMELNRGRKYSEKKPKPSTRYKAKTFNNTLVNLMSFQTMYSTPSFQTPVQKFLRKLYAQKMKDLRTINNKKQEQIFISRIDKKITQDTFEASQCDFGINSIIAISQYIKSSQIKTLNLDKNPIGDEGVKKLSKVFPLMKLKNLSLVSINITSKGGKQLLKNIVGIQTLQSINFSSPEGFNRNRFNPDGIESIKDVLQHENCRLREINLANISMGQKGFRHFCEGFNKNNKFLQTLNISMNDIRLNKDDLKFYCEQLSILELKKLDFSQNRIGDVGLQLFAQILGNQYGRNTLSMHLRELNISRNFIKSYNCELFCTQLVKNKSLTHLYLNNNPLTDGDKFYHFKFFLSHSWTLTHLGLRNCLSWQSDLKIVSEGMEKNHSLISLDVSHNSYDQESFLYFLIKLNHNKTLKFLKFENCNIIDRFIVKAEQHLKNNPKIQSLDLSSNYINDRGAKILLRLLTQNNKIYSLNLKKNCISLGILNEIQFTLRENEINHGLSEPDLHRYNLIEQLQDGQKKQLTENIQQLSFKMNKTRMFNLVHDIVEKQSQIAQKMKKIEQQQKNVSNLHKQYARKGKTDNFMVTS